MQVSGFCLISDFVFFWFHPIPLELLPGMSWILPLADVSAQRETLTNPQAPSLASFFCLIPSPKAALNCWMYSCFQGKEFQNLPR